LQSILLMCLVCTYWSMH